MVTRILVVDDDELGLKLTSDTLSRAGYEIFPVTSGPEALKQVDDVKPNLIILDVGMPEMDGYEVCRRLRHRPNTAHLPIMMLTGKDTLEEKIKGFEVGADEYMTKPFQAAELRARVKVLLRRVMPPQREIAKKLQGKIIAVFSLRGGVGVSTLAANLATGLAQLWEHSTVLVDLAFMAGQSALMLNLSRRNSWADLAQIPLEEIDSDLVNNILLSHASGAYVLAAPRRPEQGELLTAQKVSHVLNLLSEQYHYVILDLPHNFHGITLAGLDAAHQILALMAPELASAQAMASTLDVFENLGYPRDSVLLVLNQNFKRSDLTREAIENALNCQFDLIIPFASDTFVQAINVGTPPILSTPEAPASALLEDLAFHISKEEHRNQRPEAPSKAWLRVARRLQQQRRR